MTELAKGGNAPLADAPVTVELRYAGGSLDVSALLLGAEGRVRSDDDMVFFNQPAAEAGAVRLTGERIVISPGALPSSVDRVAVVASCDPEDARRTFAEVRELAATAAQEGGAAITFSVPPMTGGERAAVLLEIYRRGTGWKVRAVGQGYAAGLAGLATDFGITVDDDPAADAAPATAPAATAPVPAPVPPAEPPAPARINVTKPPLGSISLEKKGQVSLSLDKQDRELVVTAMLEWDGGSKSRRARGADLDLYGLFIPAADALRGQVPAGTVVEAGHQPHGTPVRTPEQARASAEARQAELDALARLGSAPNQRKKQKKLNKQKRPNAANRAGVVYYDALGSLETGPFIRLDGDAKEPGRETIQIARADEQGYVLLCAYSALSNGVGSFHSFGAKVVVTDGRGSTVTVPLFEKTSTRYWVAIALVDFTDPEGAAIRHVEAYGGKGAEERPVLHRDGTIEMDAGPVEFKDW